MVEIKKITYIKKLQVYCMDEKCINYRKVIDIEWECNKEGSALKNQGWICPYCLNHLCSPTNYHKS